VPRRYRGTQGALRMNNTELDDVQMNLRYLKAEVSFELDLRVLPASIPFSFERATESGAAQEDMGCKTAAVQVVHWPHGVGLGSRTGPRRNR
jgi:hypothetical protein